MADPFFQPHRRGEGLWITPRGMSNNATKQFINNLILENTVQTRTATILLATFNVLAAMVMILYILYDAWRNSKTRILLTVSARGRFDFLRRIHAAEILPFALSIGIVVQGVTFIGIQARGLKSIHVQGCKPLSQVAWPAIWIVGYTLLVFGVEIAWRGFQRNPFAPRGRWNASICWGVVIVLLLLTWIPSHLRPTRMRHCDATLIWWTFSWSDFGVGIASFLMVSYVTTAALIYRQLYRNVKVDPEERISASRAVYYLGVGALMFSLLLPFFITALRHRGVFLAGKIAGIVLNIFGFVMGFLHLLLRSNSEASAIRPLSMSWARKPRWRLFGASDLDMGAQLETPVALEQSMGHYPFTRTNSEKGRRLLSPEIQPVVYDIRSPQPPISPLPPPPPKSATPTALGHKKSQSYSCFPLREPSVREFPSLAMVTEDNGALRPPEPLFVRRHLRDSSTVSSATVQIGLRLSHGIMPESQSFNPSTVNLPIQSPSSPSSSILRLSPSPMSIERSRESSAKSMELPIQLSMSTQMDGYPRAFPFPEEPEPAVVSLAEIETPPWPTRASSFKNRRNGAQITVIRRPSKVTDPRNKKLPPTPKKRSSESLSLVGEQPLAAPTRSTSDASQRPWQNPDRSRERHSVTSHAI